VNDQGMRLRIANGCATGSLGRPELPFPLSGSCSTRIVLQGLRGPRAAGIVRKDVACL